MAILDSRRTACVICIFVLTFVHTSLGQAYRYQENIDRCPSNLARDRYLRTYGTKCYQFDYEEMFWGSAASTCRKRGGNLVTIRSKGTQLFIQRALEDLVWRRNGIWIGATDRADEMNWRWVTGENVKWGFQNWDSGQPSCFLLDFLCLDDCACLRLDEGYKWHDYHCSTPGFTYSFICEYDMKPPKPTRPPPPTTSTTTTTTTTTSTTTTSTTTTTTLAMTTSPTRRSSTPSTTRIQYDATRVTSMLTNSYSASLKTSSAPIAYGIENVTGKVVLKELPPVESQRLAADEGSLQTGSVVGIVVSFVLVFIAGLVVGVFLCRRRYKKRYEEPASSAFNNVVYSAAPSGPSAQDRVKNTNLTLNLSQDEPDDDTGNHYTDIDDITCSGDVSMPKRVDIDDACREEEHCDVTVEEGACGGPPPPCPGVTIAKAFAPEFLQKGTDTALAYSNNLYDVPSNSS